MTDNIQKQSGWAKVGNAIDSITDSAGAIAGFAMLFVAVIITYEVIMRHFFKAPTIWTYDISGYILVWFGFLSSAYGLKQGGHIHVDILVGKMRPRTKIPLEIIAYVLCSLYALIMFVYSWQMAMDAFHHNETAPTILQAPMCLVELGIVIGTFLLSLQALRMLIVKISEWIQSTRIKEDSKDSSGIINNPWLILPCYLILSALGIWCYVVSPGIGLVFIMIILLFAGVPVFTSLGIVGTLGLFILLGSQSGLPQTAAIGLKSLDNFILLAVPLYILVGQILMESGIGKELFDICVKWFGHLPGGMTVAAIGACAIFAAISGSSVATAATVGMVAIPEMLKRSYDPKLVYGTIASGGTLGILIPPSAAMIIYSSITDESTGALFMGGVIPGIIMAILFALFAVIFCVYTGRYEKIEPFSWKERFVVFKDSFWGLMTPVIIIVTIYTGVCTPTEAAALAVVYALAVSLFRGKIKPKELKRMMAKSTRTSTMILMIVVGALQLGMITTFLQVPQRAVALVGALDFPVWVIMGLLCLIFVILGMFLEVVSILLITMPIVHPLIIHMGFNGVWFGVFIVLLMEMALITPPVGLNVYVIQGIANARMSEVILGVLPFMALLLVGLLLLWFFPQLVLWFPGTMGLGGL
ncbi:TRAP transporter large permease subunit [Desulfobacula sp.]|uniref:TRAP transporter large permease subunit n=1 Tax=Desulfobacula sp. TaxID=2593537 RepID=UPI00262D3863|nr:TRAP transporter large permease subunit [Desulfobacula sp.]